MPSCELNMDSSPAPETMIRANSITSVICAVTIFLGAFLLFQVQPMIAKAILPWFGGSAAVWTACMLFFQTVLVLGYAYAHWLQARPAKFAVITHLALLAVSLTFLPIGPSLRWNSPEGADPLIQTLKLLGMTIGVPYFALASTGPLLQSWFSIISGGRSPWRLFALSNFGSMLG